MSKRTRQKRSRPRRNTGSGVSSPSRSKTQSEWERLAKYRGGGSGGESSQDSRWDAVGRRIDVSYDVLGHPYHISKPVEEGKHYETLAYTDWGDTFVPTVVKWNHGAVDSFTDPAKSRENQRRALQHAGSSGMSQKIKLPVGGGTLKVGGKEYVFRTGDCSYEAAQEKAKDLRKQGHKAVIRKEQVAGKPTYVIYTRKEEAPARIRSRVRVGDRVRVTPGSGLDRGMVGTVVGRDQVRTDGRAVPTNVEGAYKPIDWGKETVVRLDDGRLISMYKNRLKPEEAIR